MARNYRVQVAIQADTALPEDQWVNVWHFRHDGFAGGTTPADSANDMVDQLESFYHAIDGVLLPSAIVGSTAICKVYDLADAEPRTPVLTRNITLTNNVGDPAPAEVAICLSMKGETPSGTVAARRRGRIYLGPIIRALTEVQDAKVVIPNDYRTAIRDAFVAAFETGLTSTDPEVAIYSRTTDTEGASLDDSMFPVRSCYVDNALDTQRRRGHAATARTSWTIDHS